MSEQEERNEVRVEDIDPSLLTFTAEEWQTAGEEKPGPVMIKVEEAKLGALKYKKGPNAGKVIPTCEMEISILARPNQKYENPAKMWPRINLMGRSIRKFKNLAEKGCDIRLNPNGKGGSYVEVMKAMTGKICYAQIIDASWKDDDGQRVEKRDLGYRFGKSFKDVQV